MPDPIIFDEVESGFPWPKTSLHMHKRGLWRSALCVAVVLLTGCQQARHPQKPKLTKANGAPRIKLFWNSWAEDSDGPRFLPVPTLKPNTEYRIALDLAELEYRAAGVIAVATNQSFNKEVDKWLKPGMPPPTLKVLLLADKRMFNVNPTSMDFKVNLVKLRRVWKRGPINADVDPFLILRNDYDDKEQEPEFEFGGTTFEVQTTHREGLASGVFSIWYKNRPIQEVPFQFCTARSSEAEKSCADLRNKATQGMASVRLAAEGGNGPAASLLFVEVSQGAKVTAVLHLRSWSDDQFLVWQLKHAAKDFRKVISEDFLRDIGKASSDENLLYLGEALFAELFPKGAKNYDGRNVREVVLSLLLEYFQKHKDPAAEGYKPPVIFVRMLQLSPSPPPPVPLGLLAIRIDNNKPMTKENGRFLGQYFLVEAPLELQTYSQTIGCLSRWAILLPPEGTTDPTSKRARMGLDQTIFRWQREGLSFVDMPDFKEWARGPQDSKEIDPPTALLTLSHQDHNTLYFEDPAKKSLKPSTFDRRFAEFSVAVLNGCGTGGDGAVQLIGKLNENGFSTIIATSTEISADIAAAFVNQFAAQISKSTATKPLNIGQAYWQTLQQLTKVQPVLGEKQEVKGPEFGGQALRFLLLGNDQVLVCPPGKNLPSTQQ